MHASNPSRSRYPYPLPITINGSYPFLNQCLTLNTGISAKPPKRHSLLNWNGSFLSVICWFTTLHCVSLRKCQAPYLRFRYRFFVYELPLVRLSIKARFGVPSFISMKIICICLWLEIYIDIKGCTPGIFFLK